MVLIVLRKFMDLKFFSSIGLALLVGCSNSDTKKHSNSPVAVSPGSRVMTNPSFSELSVRAQKFNSVLTIPKWEETGEALKQSVQQAIRTANASLDAVGKLPAASVDFNNTIKALDDLGYQAGLVANRVSLIKETHTNAPMREAATESIKEIQDWAVGLDYREDVYRAVKAYAAKNPVLEGEEKKMLEEVLRDYRRAGLELPKEQRQEVERLRKELARICTDFDTHINEAKTPVKFSRADLLGVPESFLDQKAIKTGSDEYTVMANVTFQFVTVMDNAKNEETRKRLQFAHDTLAKEKNIPLLKEIIRLRQEIAAKLGYKSWADFQIEPKMAKNGKTAIQFLEDLKTGLQVKFDAEVAEFQQLKAKDTGNPSAKIELWDWRYYSNQLKKEKYTVDSEQLRKYFQFEKVLAGMFSIFENIFGIQIREMDAPQKWIEDLKLYSVVDTKTGEPLGLFYMDNFPRDGKYNHFAQFGIVEGKLLESGKYQRPTVALICNFPPPEKDKPSLLAHRDVETLFHEFGHALHSILTRAKYSRFAGTSVPRDFVEAPSQMLENWVWDKKVLDSFASHYQNPAQKIPKEIIEKMEAAKLGTVGTFYRRQLCFGLLDLKLHSDPEAAKDPVKLSNQVIGDVFFPVQPDTAFVAYFGHLTGYDAGYYGYAWADAIAADMATVFEKSKDGYYDAEAGRRLRKEIYEPGGSRDVNISIGKFLGRERSIEPFLKTLGIEKKPASKN